MKSPHKIIAASLAILLSGASLAGAGVGVGQPFPNLSDFALTAGSLPSLSGRVVLVDFWATWCSPCRSSFPAYGALQNEFGDRGLTIVGVSVDQDGTAYADFLDKYSPAFVTVRDAQQQLVTAVRPPAMPTCFLIDQHGVVRAVHSGFHGKSTLRELRNEITKLLEEKP
jgi:thiol-disulfide isomerase/thioredoxin